MALKWVPVDVYHMPVLPPELGVDPILSALLHMACFMELSDERTVEFNESMVTLQVMGLYFQRLKPKQVKEITAQLKRVADYGKKQKWKKEALTFIRSLLKNAGIEG